MNTTYIIKEVPTTRYIGIERAAKGLRISPSHLSMCLRGLRPLAKAKRARLQIVRITEVQEDGKGPAT